MGQVGAEAIAQGNEIAFAPGKANFSARSGQERMGHELSHVMSQRSGQVRGSGFLNNAALEARADREGAMAAAGEQVYAGPVTHAISDASPSPFAAGAMQAKRSDGKKAAAPKPAKVKPPKLTKAQKKAKENADRMYRIQAGMMQGLEDENLNSQKDLDWYEHMKENADLETYTELYNRGTQTNHDLVDYRNNLEGDDIDQKNYEASWSDASLKRDIFSTVTSELMNSPGANQYMMKIQEKDTQNIRWNDKERAISAEATKIGDANFLGSGSNDKSNRYARTKVSPEEFARREAQRKDRFRQIALGGRKKKK